MSDFDFDELDKAVAGAVGSDSGVPEQPVEEVASKPAETEPTEVQKIVPAARRSSGRFMDVVHPSSDMRSRTSPAVVATSSSSRSGVSAFTPPVARTNEIPAPESALDSAEKLPAESLEDGVVGGWSKPLESPFLTDAKVEKRPLGRVGAEPAQALLDAPEEELLLESNLPDPIDFAAQTAAATLPTEKEDTGEAEAPEADAQEQSIEQLDELTAPEVSTPPVLEVKTAEVEEPVGPASISQQYTEQPGTQQQSGAIYDTENYHKPLAPAPKKRSGVWTVIWILLLVILGASAGVAFYLFVLPML